MRSAIAAPFHLRLALGLGFVLAAGCIPDNGGKAPSTGRTRVGNNDPRGVDDQPDWDQQARELRQRVDSRLPHPLPSDHRAVCEAMLDEALAFYMAVETDPDRRADRMGDLQDTRDADVEGCLRETSVAAAACVTVLLGDRDSEFPWLLDQCSRAYPGEHADVDGSVEGATAAAPTKAERIELTFVGDVIFGRYREDNAFDPIVEGKPEKIAEAGLTDGPFAALNAADKLRSDVLVGNLETPVIEALPDSSPIGAKFRFGGDREMVQMLYDAGFQVLSLANNHYFDLREDGQLQSPTILREVGITPIGGSRTEDPVFRVETHEAKGWTIGFLSVTNRVNAPVRENTPQVPYLELRDMVDTLTPLITDARASHDLLVVAIHWGDEYAETPSNLQQKTARALLDAGVDMLVGHHPHVLQGVERHGDGLIAYSMGNFLFEHTGAIPRLTGVLRTGWRAGEGGACLDEVVFHPAYMKRVPYPHPAPATGGMGKQVRQRVTTQAERLGSSFEAIEGSEDLRMVGVGCGDAGSVAPDSD